MIHLDNKNRRIPASIWWRIDCDYLNKLNLEELFFWERFVVEYYLDEDRVNNSLHEKSDKRNSDAMRIARNDIVTAHKKVVAEAIKPALNGNLKKRPTYNPDDYFQEARSPAPAIIEYLTPVKEQAGKKRNKKERDEQLLKNVKKRNKK